MKYVFTLLLLIFLIYTINAQKDSAALPAELTKSTPKEKFYILNNLCTYYYQTGRSDSMLTYAQELLKTAQLLKNDSFIIASYKVLGNCSRLKSDYISAIEYYFKAVHLAENQENLTGLLAILYNNIGDNYNKLGYHNEALKYLKKAQQLISINGNGFSKYAVYIYTNLAETFLWTGNPDSALYYIQFADNANLTAKDNYIKSAIFLVYGMTYVKSITDIELAEYYYKKSINFSDSMLDYKHLENSSKEYARFLLRQGKNNHAKYYALYSFQISKKYDYKDNIIENSELLSQIYDYQKRTDSAYYYSRLKNEYSDSVFNMQKQNQLLSMTFNEQIREKAEEDRKLEESKQRKLNIQYSFIAIALVTISILFLILSHSIIVDAKIIVFLGEIVLLITFEFINLVIHPFIERVAHHSPFFILMILVIIASLLIPIHHYLEEFVKHKLVEKNKKIKIRKAKETQNTV